jgi:carbonyl reductase 1
MVVVQALTIPPTTTTTTTTTQRIALITGSNKGIGLEIVRKLGSLKKKRKDDDNDENENDNENDVMNEFVCLMGCRNEQLGREAVQELQSQGMTVKYVRIDLVDTESIQSTVKYIEETYGRCDVLVNNAAVCFNDPTLYGKVPHTPFDKQADLTVRTNFFGTLALTNAMIPLLQKSNSSPRIINIASSAGRLSILPSSKRRKEFSSNTLTMNELEGYMRDFIKAAQGGTHSNEGWPNTGYGVSKVGIIAMTKILAREENENSHIMINSVDPGYCATDQNNHQGFISAERGAVTPFLLATMENQFLSGSHWYQEQEIEW